jgi:Calcineurin-like phosphoesterase
MVERTIAIGDIHGCSVALAALVDAIDFQTHDTLVTLGDYVNKGVDSKGVFDVLLDLETRCRLIPLIGNHDAIMLGVIDGSLDVEGWKAIGGTATLQSYGDLEHIDDLPEKHAEFLRR